jgi:PAS domain S-box-containing protein
VRFNRAGEELLGLSRSELIGKNDYDFFPKEEADFFQAKDRETLEKGVLVDILEEPIDTKHGRRWLHTKKVPVLGEDGTPQYLLGISEDITERKAADAALREAKTAAETANRELEAFSYSVAHDLRAPLRSIDGFSRALIEDCGDQLGDSAKRYLDRVRASALRMGELIDDLLRLSRVTRAEMHRERVDLSAMARGMLESLSLTSRPEREVELVVEDGLAADGDARLLAVVFDNLLGNAWKFTSKRERARIEVGATEVECERHYYVRDNGAGFDMSYVGKLFGVFERLHSASEFEGTGVGLATVQRIVRRHGGRVWAEGTIDGGATFYFTLGEEPLS